ncbi:PIG-L family deacetylase [Candidatus Shapirobacteria bacterium]|nr:PIG-L family deacetylase [Candidatus Shapirobacteria bacterium]
MNYLPIGILIFFICLWLVGFFKANDLSIPSRSPKNIRKILVILPHPDDESLTVSGLLNQFSGESYLLTLTHGGAGENASGQAGDLRQIREQELQKSADIIGIKHLINADFVDGSLTSDRNRLSNFIDNKINELQPDLVITYDLSGLYGHPDHVVVSEIVTALVKDKYSTTALWYTTLPQKLLSMINLPTHMATDQSFLEKRTTPNLKVYIDTSFITRIRSVYAHRSQFNSFRSGVPRLLPLWFAYSFQLFEYYHEV